LCGSGLLTRTSRKYKGSQFYTCDKLGNNPECPFISWDLPMDGKVCETCGTYMVWKRFKGRSYPRCGNKDCPTNQRKAKAGKETQDTTVTAVVADVADDANAHDANAAGRLAATADTDGEMAGHD
jgi:ssDNA-binding Zn-finger/Zn-ribbon topoisomerase 1